MNAETRGKPSGRRERLTLTRPGIGEAAKTYSTPMPTDQPKRHQDSSCVVSFTLWSCRLTTA
jgi:hypothetical protein